MTDIALKVEQVSSMNTANNYNYLSTDRISKKSVPLVLQPLTCERADSLDVHRVIHVDLANSRTCGTHNSVLAEAAVRTVPLQK